MIRYLLISLVFCFFIQCANNSAVYKKTDQSPSPKTIHLYGKITIEELYEAFPAWEEIENDYNADETLIDSLAGLDKGYRVEIFLGTWCGDSRRETPRFIKIWKKTGLYTLAPMTLYAVDRNKELGNGLAKDRDIQFVPTFIIYGKDQEIGRIIESPDDTLEKDVVKILFSN